MARLRARPLMPKYFEKPNMVVFSQKHGQDGKV
jgi:hypothetical protein